MMYSHRVMVRRPCLMVPVLLGWACAPTVHAQCTDWYHVNSYFWGTPPSPRYWTPVAHDTARNAAVVFGGNAPGAALADTWEWNGTVWTQRSPINAPSRRYLHGIAYDSQRHVTVLFGGRDETSAPLKGDTWEWDGTDWTQRATTGPTPRRGAAMVYDPIRHVTVLFGGQDSSGVRGDTWTWDGIAWTLASSSGPSARRDSCAAFDGSRVILFGGWDGGSGYSSDTWSWNGAVWSLLQPSGSGPTARTEAAMAFDSLRGRTVLYGGRTNVSTGASAVPEVWELDGTGWHAASPPALSTGNARFGHAMYYDPGRDRIVAVFGQDSSTTARNDLLERTASDWLVRVFNLMGGPYPGDAIALAYDTDRHRTVLFGGNRLDPGTFEFDGHVWTQVAASGPRPRLFPKMVYDQARHRVVLWGGVADGTAMPLSESELMWLYDPSAGVWTNVPMSPGIAHPSADQSDLTYDSARQRVVCVQLNPPQTWEWDGAAWTLVSTAGPAGYINAGTIAYDPVRQRTVVFGAGFDPHFETWEWNGADQTWFHVPIPTPPIGARTAPMVYHSALNRLVLFAGCDAPFSCHDTWFYDGGAWTQWTGVPTQSRSNADMVYDTAAQAAFTCFGREATPGDWFFGTVGALAPVITQQPNPTVICDGTGSFLQLHVATEAITPAIRWRRDGQIVVPYFQSFTASVESYLYVSEAGVYDAEVRMPCGATVVSSPATVTVSSAPLITEQPAAIVRCPGETATFSVVSSGPEPLSYSWTKDGMQLFDDSNVMGAFSSSLSISGLSLADAGDYTCYVFNECALVTTIPARLRVCGADFNCSGTVSVQDIFDFLAAYFAGDSRADFNGSGAVSVQDIFDFLATYFAGCP